MGDDLVRSIVLFSETAVAFLTFVMIGITGNIVDVQIREQGLIVKTVDLDAGFAFCGIGYYHWTPRDGETEAMRDHEYGHLCHEDELDILYLPISALTSFIAGRWFSDRYYDFWTERTATEYGATYGSTH